MKEGRNDVKKERKDLEDAKIEEGIKELKEKGGRSEGKTEGTKESKKEGRKDGKKEGKKNERRNNDRKKKGIRQENI